MKAALVSKSALQIARFYVLWFTIANVQAATQIKNSCSVSALKSIQPVLDFIKQADEQKNIGCVEELYPSLPSDLECAGTHLNADLIERCALKPQVAEEIKNPGHRVPFDHWMMMHVFIDRDKKIDLIYDAAKKYNMPPQFLYAVVNLEGSMTDLGVVKDGGNYSCGTGSVNIYQWCRWMNTLSKGEQTSIDWPIGISCEDDTLPPGIVGAVFDRAHFSKSVTAPSEYLKDDWQVQLQAKEADEVGDQDILKNLKAKFSNAQNKTRDEDRLKAIRSFTRHCMNVSYSIPAIAFGLRDLFDRLVPNSLKENQVYSKTETFSRPCKFPYSSKFTPMNSGWLLAYGMHNQGEELGEGLQEEPYASLIQQIKKPKDLHDLLMHEGQFDRKNIKPGDPSMRYDVLIDPLALQVAARNIAQLVGRMTLDHSNPFTETGVATSPQEALPQSP